MKGARKQKPPKELIEWLALENDDWKPSYPFNTRVVRDAVEKSLFHEQRGLCVYCGRRLDMSDPGKSFHIEHFRPQHGPNKRPDLAVSYSNLFLSCGHKDKDGNTSPTCGTRKADWFDEGRHVAPAYNDCTLRFRFLLSGKITTVEVGDSAANEMILQLGLDHPELVRARKTTLALIDGGDLDVEDFWDEVEEVAQSFAHVAYQNSGSTIP